MPKLSCCPAAACQRQAHARHRCPQQLLLLLRQLRRLTVLLLLLCLLAGVDSSSQQYQLLLTHPLLLQLANQHCAAPVSPAATAAQPAGCAAQQELHH
jgi:hypothetical protein